MNLVCGCKQDPEYHRELNERRNKLEAGDKCTNIVPDDVFLQQGGMCMACIFGCYE